MKTRPPLATAIVALLFTTAATAGAQGVPVKLDAARAAAAKQNPIAIDDSSKKKTPVAGWDSVRKDSGKTSDRSKRTDDPCDGRKKDPKCGAKDAKSKPD